MSGGLCFALTQCCSAQKASAWVCTSQLSPGLPSLLHAALPGYPPLFLILLSSPPACPMPLQNLRGGKVQIGDITVPALAFNKTDIGASGWWCPPS